MTACAPGIPSATETHGTTTAPGATVARSGTEGIEVVLDDGTRRVVPSGALRGARSVRRGQRVLLVDGQDGPVLQLPQAPLTVRQAVAG